MNRAKLLRQKRTIDVKKESVFRTTLSLLNKKIHSRNDRNWLKYQGPYCPSLITYINNHKNSYDVFIFFTYLYYPSVEGIKIVGNKSIFIPTAHDEPEIYAPVYRSPFENAKFIMYNTESEKNFVQKLFTNITNNHEIAGVGISLATKNNNLEISTSTEYHFNFKYILYMGRVDAAKGCSELYKSFETYKEQHPLSKTKLVYLGQKIIDLPQTENIIFTGFVSESVKQLILSNCEALIIPSHFESLSMVTLEAMYEKKIVIANGECEVLKDHIIKSNSGFYYHNDKELFTVLTAISTLSREEINQHGANAKKYVENNYTWESILNKFDKAIDFIQKS